MSRLQSIWIALQGRDADERACNGVGVQALPGQKDEPEGRKPLSEAAQLGQPTVSGDAPKMPPATVVALAERFEPEAAAALQFQKVRGASEIFTRAMLSRDVKWEAAGSGIKATYDGGSAFFAVRHPEGVQDLRKRAELYNSLSNAFWQTIGTDQILEAIKGNSVHRPQCRCRKSSVR